jgi:hypothetical protein
VRSSKVLQHVVDTPMLRISGPPLSGRTSLAKTLYRELLDRRQIVPVLINGSDFRNTTYDSVVGVISRNFKKQYSDKLYTRFSQLQDDERIFIIDDWQHFPLNFEAKQLVLDAFKKYGGRLLLFSDEGTVFQEITQLGDAGVFADFTFCGLKQFGHVLRSRLINNWVTLGREFQLDDFELANAVSVAEHLLDTLISTGVVPSFPLFVFSVLQASTNLTGTAGYGSFGHIYEQLLTKRLGIYGQKLVGAKLALLSRIAFKMHSLNRIFVTEHELRTIEDRYSNEYAVAEDITHWKTQFVDAKILQAQSGEFKFVYKYAYYFLLALYFHDEISNAQEAAELICQLVGMIDAAHDEDKARTLIFYLYLSKNRDLIERIIAKASGILTATPKFDISKDLSFASSLCTRHPPLLAPSGDHKTNREAYNEQKDAALEQNEREKEERQARELSLSISSAFQLLEIMGQVVRNFPLELRADLKRDLIRESYSLGLRLLKDFLVLTEQNYTEIAHSLRSFLREHTAFARKADRDIAYASNMVLVNLVEGVVVGAIKKVSFSVGVRDLRETYQQVRELAGEADLSMRMIDLTITLEHFARIPEEDVVYLKSRLESDVVGYTVLRMLVGEFLSLFPCEDFRLRQRIEKLLDFVPNDPRMVLNKLVQARGV